MIDTTATRADKYSETAAVTVTSLLDRNKPPVCQGSSDVLTPVSSLWIDAVDSASNHVAPGLPAADAIQLASWAVAALDLSTATALGGTLGGGTLAVKLLRAGTALARAMWLAGGDAATALESAGVQRLVAELCTADLISTLHCAALSALEASLSTVAGAESFVGWDPKVEATVTPYQMVLCPFVLGLSLHRSF